MSAFLIHSQKCVKQYLQQSECKKCSDGKCREDAAMAGYICACKQGHFAENNDVSLHSLVANLRGDCSEVWPSAFISHLSAGFKAKVSLNHCYFYTSGDFYVNCPCSHHFSRVLQPPVTPPLCAFSSPPARSPCLSSTPYGRQIYGACFGTENWL